MPTAAAKPEPLCGHKIGRQARLWKRADKAGRPSE